MAKRKRSGLAWPKNDNPAMAVLKKIVDEPSCKLSAKEIDILRRLWRYMLWARRTSLCHQQSPEYAIADGMVVKHHRLLYGLPLNPVEERLIAKAEKLLRKSKACQ